MTIDFAAIQDFILAQGALAPLVYMLILTLATVIAPFPGWPFVVASAAIFGPFWGAVYATPAVCLGATIAFGLARRYGRPLILRLVPAGRLDRIENQLSGQQQLLVLLILRLMPFSPFDVINYAVGLTRMSYRHFILVTLVGVVPHNFALAYFGHFGLTADTAGLAGLGSLLLLAVILWPRLMRWLTGSSRA